VKPLLIVGASGRAAAASAIRAGFVPTVLDLYGDRDTRSLADVYTLPMRDYPHGFVEMARSLPMMQWLPAGGLENHVEVCAGINEHHHCSTLNIDALRQVRDPWLLSSIQASGATYAEVLPRNAVQMPEDYLRKPLKSAGGMNIRDARQHDDPSDSTAYYQKRIGGGQRSAVFYSDGDNAVSLGQTQQLIGEDFLHADAFQYCGNISLPYQPEPLGDWPRQLVKRTGIRGLFGIDYLTPNVIVEVNPRYPASLEVLELASQMSLLKPSPATPNQQYVIGKAIYYAPRSTNFPKSGPWEEDVELARNVWRVPQYADIPAAGEHLDVGQPVCTLMTLAASILEVRKQLIELAVELHDRLYGAKHEPE
jgi:uncharacterized protein